ncbi:MAG: CDP-alcohol phosphatidyltransferase family protein [Chloroflexota bacterium]
MANLITLARLPVLLAIVLLLATPSPAARLANVPLLVALILMDTLDGVVARRRHEESLMGSVLDIMADRAVELVLWVCYAYYRLIPLAIPVIYILRGTIVDSLRSVGVSEGQAPFKTMRTSLGRWLVGSPWMRSSYGVAKAFAFAGLALTHALAAYAAHGAVSISAVEASRVICNVVSWVAVALCLARGLPVVVEALPALRRPHPLA